MSTAIQSPEISSPTRERNYRPLLYAVAVLFAAATILYSAAWMYYQRRDSPQVEIGFDDAYSAAGIEAKSVHANSPAERAGLKTNDLIIGINGKQSRFRIVLGPIAEPYVA